MPPPFPKHGNLKILRTMTLRGSPLPSLQKLLSFVLIASLLVTIHLVPAFADGTRTWEQSKFDEFTKGTATGVAIRSTGSLALAPAFKLLYAAPSTYIWALTADDAGNVY